MCKHIIVLTFVVKVRQGLWDGIELFVFVVFREEEIELVKVVAPQVPNEGDTIKLIRWEGEKRPKRITNDLVGIV